MKRLLLAVLACASFIGISAAPAQAYTRINANCILRAFTPNSNTLIRLWSGQGEVDCGSNTNITLAVCLQQLVSTGWQNVYCTQGSTGNNTFLVSTYGVTPVSGRWYRSEDQGWAGSGYAQYWSSGVQG